MLRTNAKQLIVTAAAAALWIWSPSSALAGTTNINLAVASNFYGIPPDNSAITDVINAFEAENQAGDLL
jgi:hypothetical protein